MTDYMEMWKGLGMDLETHDQLCQVLPTAFGDVYLSQQNRPEGMGFWDFVVSEIHGIRPAELIEAQKNGQKVFGTFCVYVPDEVVVAANGIVTGLCGGSQFWVPGGEKVLPKSTCPLVKASVGARLDRTCPFFRIADIYVGETTCDAKKKAYEIPEEYVITDPATARTGVEVVGEDGERVFTSFDVLAHKNGCYYAKTDAFEAGTVIGKDNDPATMKLKKKRAFKGVYNINKGYAAFQAVDIVASNEAYYIINEQDIYGPALYDQIALNAAKMSENKVVQTPR